MTFLSHMKKNLNWERDEMTLEELIKKRLADSAKFILERNE